MAPSLLKIKGAASAAGGGAAEYGHGDAGGLFIYMVPLAPGHTRAIVRRTVPVGARAPLAIEIASALIIPAHLLLSDVFDGDLVFLHAQERTLREAGASAWRNAYFLATAEDVGVAFVRRWMDQFGGAFGDAPLPAREPSRRVLLDRWGQHAAHCAACRAAGERAGAAARGLRVAAGIAGAAAAAGLLVGGGEVQPALLAAAAASPALGAAAQAAGRLEALLRFKDYVHGRT
jgi:hypothetical protein